MQTAHLLCPSNQTPEEQHPRLVRGAFWFLDFLDELQQLLSLAIAHVKKANTNVDRVIESLRDPSKAKWQAFNTKFNLHTAKNANRKPSIRANVTSAKADVDDSALNIGSQVY